jgi:hypothetical protein
MSTVVSVKAPSAAAPAHEAEPTVAAAIDDAEVEVPEVPEEEEGELDAHEIPAYLSEDKRKLLQNLLDINGQDAYSVQTAALGALRTNEYLVLPEGMFIPKTGAKKVGGPSCFSKMSVATMAQVFALNKAVAPQDEDANRFAMLRLEAVKMGWYCGQHEVRRAPPMHGAIDTFLAALGTDTLNMQTAQHAAWLVPLVAENVFKTTGHHYLTTMSADYVEKYTRILRACLADDVPGYLRPASLYHAALHWVSPARAHEVLLAQVENDRMPEAIRIRAHSAPAGTAVITTTAAVLDAMAAGNVLSEVSEAMGVNTGVITEMSAMVKAEPAKYHKLPEAFGVARASEEERANLEAVKLLAIRIAPVVQGYIDALLRDGSLGLAKALRKHAEANPLLMRRSMTYFRAISRGTATNFKEVVRATVKPEG